MRTFSAAAAAACCLALSGATAQPIISGRPSVDESSVDIDIHLPVLGEAHATAVRANGFLNEKLNNDEVDFETKHTPHVTLYLTAFSCPKTDAVNCIEQISKAINATIATVAPTMGPCDVELTQAYAAGTYAMMNVTLDDCLQTYSDAIVNATYRFSQPNQTAPSWVNDLPEPERSEKLADIKKYGSPNVFSQFQVSSQSSLTWLLSLHCCGATCYHQYENVFRVCSHTSR